MDDKKHVTKTKHGTDSERTTTATADFIVVTEFSEREGPISPLTIPMELTQEWKSNFALKVLKTEFRKKKAFGLLPSINVCDMQQIINDNNELYIYCHYTSIADTGARGYMRALCLTYITPTPKKIQRIFACLKQNFTETAMILKKAAQKTFLREMDQIIDVINNKKISQNESEISEYNDLFQCHLDEENRKNILIDMNEIRHLFDAKLKLYNDNRRHNNDIMLNRTRHRPHCVGKEGYKPLKQLIDKEDYLRFRDSLRNIHSLFNKNCLDIYVDRNNKKLSHLDPNRLFAIGSLSVIDIKPCHYLSSSLNNNNNNDNNAFYNASSSIKRNSKNKSKNKQNKKKLAPNLFLNDKDETQPQKTIRRFKVSPSKHLNGKHYNKKKQFLKLYDRKMQQIEHKNSKIYNITCNMDKIQHMENEVDNNTNNIWENFILTRNGSCCLEVQKETKSNSNNNSAKTKTRTKTKAKTKSLTYNNNKHKCARIEVRCRSSSDRAREKNLYRCLLGRFRQFADSILFTILTNRTLVILTNDVAKNREKVEKTVRALSLIIPGVENTNLTQEWRQEPLYCHQLPKLKIVGMSAELCHRSPDNIWDLITIIQFDDCMLRGPPLKCHDETKSFIHRMLHSRKRFKTPNIFYRYLSRVLLQMSLHVLIFYYISQTTNFNVQNAAELHPNAYYQALLETLQFTQPSDIDIAKHWCHIMQTQLWNLLNPSPKNIKCQENDIRILLLKKYGHRAPTTVRII